ncbi:hypothetical protein EK21DRAFT_112479 [Setomelanomma holmii]|uniref:Rhodopsin domain-containing protein n=1 Tax=Setomelanomma holmii TaxID=210430 RepID=A0A9P4H7Z7_9PLEO|nr:hypothetical protein EK21DRAFT_112479 [Setomelanomma holmii]
MIAFVHHDLYTRQTAPIVDRGTILNIVSWILLAIVVCTLTARFAMKLSMRTGRRKLGLDDFFIGLAALFSFSQTVAVSVASIHVPGRHAHDLTDSQKDMFQKAEYVACMMYIANMGCSRISVCLLIRKVLPGMVPKYTALVFAGFTAIWTVSGVLVTAFACNLPKPWNFLGNQHCYDVVAFVNYIAITNIVVEVLLVTIPLVVWNVRLSARKRISVSLVFLARLSVVAAVSAQLHFFNRSNFSDITYNGWAGVLCQQIAQNLAIISACLPCLHPFIIRVLAGAVYPETISFNYGAPPCLRQFLGRRSSACDSTSSRSSHASTSPLTEKTTEPYCRPLATYGLDQSSKHCHSHSASRFPPNVTTPIIVPRAPENVFNRLIEVPQSRPTTSTSAKDPLAMPKRLSDVGVLPIIDWELESSASGGSRRSSPSRQPTAEYVFNRQKVISVPEENHLYDDGLRKFAPPLPSPLMPARPPRAF